MRFREQLHGGIAVADLAVIDRAPLIVIAEDVGGAGAPERFRSYLGQVVHVVGHKAVLGVDGGSPAALLPVHVSAPLIRIIDVERSARP